MCTPDVYFEVTSDASDFTISAVLAQEISGEIYPITYMSSKLLPTHQRW